MDFLVNPSPQIQGTATVPGDKSISHRVALLAALATGTSRLHNYLQAEDTLRTLAVLKQLGVPITQAEEAITIEGVGLHGLQPPTQPLDCGNAGTLMRLLAGVLAGQPFTTTLVGDGSLTQRPMARIAAPLNAMGALVETTQGCAPLHIHGQKPLQAIHYVSPIASAQVKSAVLLAGLFAEGETTVTEPTQSRDHTERLLHAMLRGKALQPIQFSIPGDFSAAAFLLVAGVIAKQGKIRINNVGINPTRTGLLPLLSRMGATLVLENQREGIEPVADITASAGTLSGIDVSVEETVKAIDEIPLLAIAAATAKGVTRIHGIDELRHKESDRVQAIVSNLQHLGISAEVVNNSLQIVGGQISGGTVQSFGDHRIAMAFAVAAVAAEAEIQIKNVKSVATSFPAFAATMDSIGLRICATMRPL